MALEDMIEHCIGAGVTHFELHPMWDDRETGEPVWHWDLYQGDPLKWINIVAPWDIVVSWIGFGSNLNRLWGVLPVRVTFWPTWRIGIPTGGKRHGWQMTERPTFEAGLRAALGTYLCECEGSECRHEICEYHGTDWCDVD